MKKILVFVCALVMLVNVPAVSAEEVRPAATNIIALSAGITTTSAGCIVGEVTGAFTGDGLHAIYYTNVQWLNDNGVWTNVGTQRTFRAYDVGVLETFEIYYCYPEDGEQYRIHVEMKVVDNNGNMFSNDGSTSAYRYAANAVAAASTHQAGVYYTSLDV